MFRINSSMLFNKGWISSFHALKRYMKGKASLKQDKDQTYIYTGTKWIIFILQSKKFV